MISAAVDPGIRGSGLAIMAADIPTNDHAIVFATYVKNPVTEGDGPAAVLGMAQALRDEIVLRHPLNLVRRLAVEVPRVYQGSKQKGDPNDLLPLAGVAYALGAMVSRGAEVVRYFPHEWKGQTPSNATARRILARLLPSECLALPWLDELRSKLAACEAADKEIKTTGYKWHNALDAVGIALKAGGRFEARHVTHY